MSEKKGKDQLKENGQNLKSHEKEKAVTSTALKESTQTNSKIGELKPMETKASSPQFVKLKKQDFKFNQKYWDGIHPQKAENIKHKYGIEGVTVDPHKVHRPMSEMRGQNMTQPLPQISMQKPIKKNTPVRPPKKKEKLNGLR